jgi:hypothetical protein
MSFIAGINEEKFSDHFGLCSCRSVIVFVITYIAKCHVKPSESFPWKKISLEAEVTFQKPKYMLGKNTACPFPESRRTVSFPWLICTLLTS